MAVTTFAHGPLTSLASNLWVVAAQTSQGLDRKMAVARGTGGSLFVHDPLWLDERAFAEFDALGRVTTIFVPSWLHDFDAERFAARYPAATLAAMPATVKKLGWPGLVPFEPAMAPSCVTVQRIPGVKFEVACEVTHPEGGASLIVNDVLFNLRPVPGWRNWLFRAMGSIGPLHMSRLGRLFLLADRAAFVGWLEQHASRTDLRHLVMAHGEIVSGDVARQLAEAAARM